MFARTTVGSLIAGGGALVAAILLLTLIPLIAVVSESRSAEEDRERFADATATADATLRLVLDVQTGVRGYVIAGDRRFLEPQQAAFRELPRRRAELRRLSREVRPLALAMDRRIDEYVEFSRRLIVTARRDLGAARAIIASGQGKRRVDALRRATRQIDELTIARSEASAAKVNSASRRALTIAIVAAALSVTVTVVFTILLTRALRRPLAEVSAAAARLGTGETAARVNVSGTREITELGEAFNSMAASLQSSRARLEMRNAELAEAHEETRRANEAKSVFLSRMSHELRTPLHSILGFSQLLALDLDRPADRERVERILRAGNHLLALIDEVLDISRIETGWADVSFEPLQIEGVVDETVEMLAPAAEAAGVTIERAAADGDCVATGDRRRVRQILLNLVSNAVKYNHDGGTVEIRCAPVPGANRTRISVTDTGPGLDTDEQSRLFEPFERLGAEATDVHGTGLGLALSRGLAELMHGSLQVESAPGAGSTFHLELPSVEAGADFAATGNGVPQASGADGARSGVILCIEDNPVNLELLEDALARLPQAEVRVAREGGVGVELARRIAPAVILLDLHLPDLTGEAVLERLRAARETAEVPVIVVSADATEKQRDRLRAAGAEAYLTKPLDVEELLRTIARHLPQR